MHFTIQRVSALSSTFVGLMALLTGLALATQADGTDPVDGYRGPVPLQERADDPADARATPQADEPFDWQGWSERLADRDLERRQAAFEELLKAARADDQARDALRAWSEDPTAGELAWTSRLALRELERTAQRERPLRRRLEERMDEPFGELFGGRSLRDFQRQLGDPFAGMEERLRELESEIERHLESLEGRLGRRPLRGVPQPPVVPAPPRSGEAFGRRSSSSTSMQIGPDGVRVRISELRDGEEHVEEYRADSIEALLEQHPELEDRVHLRPLRPRGAPAPDPAPAPQAGRPLLGIRYEPLPAERAEDLGLEPGVGLIVREVLPGSLALRLGLRPGDVLVELDGRPVGDAEDVRAALEASGGEVTARWIDPVGDELRSARAAIDARLDGVETERF